MPLEVDLALRPVARRTDEEREQIDAVDRDVDRRGRTDGGGKRRQHVDGRRDPVDIAARRDAARPAPEARHLHGAVVQRALLAAQAGVEALLLARREREVARRRARAVIARVEHDRVVGQVQVVEHRQQASDVPVDVGHHAVEPGEHLAEALLAVGRRPALRHLQRRVRSVGGEVGEERPGSMRFHERDRGIGEDIGAVALGAHRHTVAMEHRVGVRLAFAPVVLPVVARLADATGVVHERLVEPEVACPHRVGVPQVPLPERPGAVADVAEQRTDGHLAGVDHRAPAEGVDRPRALVVAPGHQAGASRRAERTGSSTASAGCSRRAARRAPASARTGSRDRRGRRSRGRPS